MKKEERTRIKIAIAAAGAAIGFTLGLIYLASNNQIGQRYRREAISLLEKYKERKIDAKEAGKRLNDLENELWKEYKESDGKKASELLDLWTDINVVNIDIYYRGYASDYKIDNAIKEIKK